MKLIMAPWLHTRALLARIQALVLVWSLCVFDIGSVPKKDLIELKESVPENNRRSTAILAILGTK